MIQQSSSPFARRQIQSSPWAVAHAEESVRTAFIRRTYLHLIGAIAAFIGLEMILFTVFPDTVDQFMATLSRSRAAAPWSGSNAVTVRGPSSRRATAARPESASA